MITVWILGTANRHVYVLGFEIDGTPKFTMLKERAMRFSTLELATSSADKINDLGRWYVEAVREQ